MMAGLMGLAWLGAAALWFAPETAPSADAVPPVVEAVPVVEPTPPVRDQPTPAPVPDPHLDQDGLRVGVIDRRKYWVGNVWPVQTLCHLGPPDRAGCLVLHADAATGLRYHGVAGTRFSEFVLDRAELGTSAYFRAHPRIDAGVRVALEAIRSAGPQSLVGIDGNSLVIRVAEAHGNLAVHAGVIDVGVRVGMVPERWLEQLQKGHDTAGLQRTPADRTDLYDRADLGGSVTVSGWRGRVEVDGELFNGEGRQQPELNRGKNTTAILTVRPVMRRHAAGPINLALHGAYRDGSIGVASARNHRGSAGIGLQSPWAYAGVTYTHALGYLGRPELTANTVGVWASAYAWAPWVGLVAQFERTQQDLRLSDATVSVVTAGAFSDLFGYLDRNRRRLRVYAAYQYEGYGADAAPLSGTPEVLNTHRLLVLVRVMANLRAL